MPRYSAFIALMTGHYREFDDLIDAPDPLAAAQQLIESGVIEPGDDFPIFLIVEERAISLFTRDRSRAVTPTDHIRRRWREGQRTAHLRLLPDDDGGLSSS